MEIHKENLLLEQFKKTTTFKRFFSTLLRFDEDLDCFVAAEKWRDKEAELLTAAWWMFSEVVKTKAAPEGFVLLPLEPTQAIKTALSYQCFDFINVAQIYRNLGFDIAKKAEDEQSFFLHKFLILAIKHGNDFIRIFNEETKVLVEAREQSHD